LNLVDLIPVPIRGRTVYVGGDSVPVVPIRPFCDHLGIAWQAQHIRIKFDAALARTVMMIVTVAEDGKQREMVVLPLTALFLWLAKINARKVAPARQELLIAFQLEAGMVLMQAWLAARQGMPAPLLKGEKPGGKLLAEMDGVPRSQHHPAFVQSMIDWAAGDRIERAAQVEAEVHREKARSRMRAAGFTGREFKEMRATWRRLRQTGTADQPRLALEGGSHE
jgi:hypothetical protein